MGSVAVDLVTASTTELVEAAAAIAAELAARRPPGSGAVCMELTEQLAGATDLQERALAALIGVVDASGEVRRWGLPSTQTWLRSRLGMREGRGRERVMLARQITRLGRVDKLWTAGDLSFGYAATIAGAVARLDDADCGTAEELLLGMVEQGFSAGKVAVAGQRIRELVAERDGTEQEPEDAQRGYERSWIASTRSLDGGRYLKGWLNAEDAAIWDGALAPLAKPAGAEDRRDLPERTAAALSTVLAGGHRATKVTVLMDLDTLTGGDTPARLPGGTTIPAEQARRIALSAGVSPLILSGRGVPLYLGQRARFASAGQRQVLESLYPACVVQGCEVPGTLCEVDHVDGWALGDSPTDIDRLALCCGWHNRFKHTNPNQIDIHHGADGRYTYRLRPPPTRHRTPTPEPEPEAEPEPEPEVSAQPAPATTQAGVIAQCGVIERGSGRASRPARSPRQPDGAITALARRWDSNP